MTTEGFLTIEQIRQLWPDEWVLLGNPIMEHTKVLGGVPVFHHKDKRELVKGKELLQPFATKTWTFTGEFRLRRKLNIDLQLKLARKAMLECQAISSKNSMDKTTLEEINFEIREVRKLKSFQ